MQKRDAALEEKLGDWTIVSRSSNQQKDGNSCGIFVLMVGHFLLICKTQTFHINPFLMNGFSHHYHFEESTFIFRGIRSDF